MSTEHRCDVMILGGGLAGLSAALQLKRARPRTHVVLAEKRMPPAPEAAFKVGESASEIGAHYLKEVIGFQPHLESEQLRKFSLRVFSSHGDNSDIARRPEIGLGRLSPLRTYQLDRGRLENALTDAVLEAGVEFLPGHTVNSFELGLDRHTVTLRGEGRTREVFSKWIVDASGRAGLIRRQLKLTVEIPHDVNAAWFRLPERLTVDEWSSDPMWRARVPTANRWQSTNHLVGEGYWIWLIPLASGPHSVGIVADPDYVRFDDIRRYDKLLEWLHEHEPQLASKLPQEEEGLLDFRKVKNYSFGVRRGISPQRWCLTGEAGLFLDPLYSTGLDFIAIANQLSVRLICGALDDEPDVKRRLKAYNSYYLGQFLGWEPAFAGQYEVFRDAQATAAKIVWDNASYFMYPVLLANNGCMLDYEFVTRARELFREHFALNVYMQRFFREWSRLEGEDKHGAGFPYGSDVMVQELFETAGARLSAQQIGELLPRNVRRLKRVAHQMVERMGGAAGVRFDPPPCDYPPAEAGPEQVEWSSYEQRVLPPESVPAQPEGAWMLR
jgi:flavin-dependent dehydrogenase